MTVSYSVHRSIAAAADRVWSLLTDGAAYPSWNPAVISVDGRIARGEKITVVSTANPKRGFTLRVSAFEAPHRMVWSSGMPLGLFTGTRTYTVDEPEPGRSEFTMREEFTGPLAPMITRSIPDLSDSFEQFAGGLKDAAENGA